MVEHKRTGPSLMAEHERTGPSLGAQKLMIRREVIYFRPPKDANQGSSWQTPWMQASQVDAPSTLTHLPYTDLILASLRPAGDSDSTLQLVGASVAFLSTLKATVDALHGAGKRVLISVGGAGFSSAQYASYAEDVKGCAAQIVDWVGQYGFDGVDIDFEDSDALAGTGAYDGKKFLVHVTRALAKALPREQSIITHAPQTPYWDPKWRGAKAPYRHIWSEIGGDIAWLNNQFYNSAEYDQTTELQRHWYHVIAEVTGGAHVLFGSNLNSATESGYLDATKLVSQIIQPLRGQMPHFGGVVGWELSFDPTGVWGQTVAKALI